MRPHAYEVFTPLGFAEHAFAKRPVVAAVRAALAVPGRALLLHGPSGAGKTTTAVRALAAGGTPALITRCRRRGGLADALAAAHGLPGVPEPSGADPAALAARVRAARRDLPEAAEPSPPTGAGPAEVAAWLRETGAAWLLDSVHKLPAPAQREVAAVIRAGTGRGRVIALGTAPELAGAPLERIAVAPMTHAELDAMLVAGAACLNLAIPAWMRAEIITHAGGHPSVCHAFALHLCLQAGVEARGEVLVIASAEDFARARAETPVVLL